MLIPARNYTASVCGQPQPASTSAPGVARKRTVTGPTLAHRCCDVVLARATSDGEIGERRVTSLVRSSGRPAIEVVVATAGGVEALLATAEHPLWTSRAEWTNAGDLRVGDELATMADGTAIVVGLSSYGELVDAFNFTVGRDHTYYVGGAEIWTHNPGCREYPHHHLLPKADRYLKHWKREKLNHHDYCVKVSLEKHRELHGPWLPQWDSFFTRYPNASRQQILRHMRSLMRRHGLNGLPIIKY